MANISVSEYAKQDSVTLNDIDEEIQKMSTVKNLLAKKFAHHIKMHKIRN